MNLTISSGPPPSGKASTILKTIIALQNRDIRVGVVKFDCLYTDDNVAYEEAGAPVEKGFSGALYLDRFFAPNIEGIVRWGNRIDLGLLISGPAGLYNRCSSYLKDIKGACVINNLSDTNAPKKIGSLLKSADIVAITKDDIMSQAERGVFASRVSSVNPCAVVTHINGLIDQGIYELGTLVHDESRRVDSIQDIQLRSLMPTALYSYCLGETRVGENYQLGNIKKMDSGEDPA